MSTTTSKKLSLHRETLRTLDTDRLVDVVGGHVVASSALPKLTGGIQGAAGNINDTVYRPKPGDKPAINDTVYRPGQQGSKIVPL